jgi:hypothetical protein
MYFLTSILKYLRAIRRYNTDEKKEDVNLVQSKATYYWLFCNIDPTDLLVM